MAEKKYHPDVLTEKEREELQKRGLTPDNYIVTERTKNIVFVKPIGFEKNPPYSDPLCGRKGVEDNGR